MEEKNVGQPQESIEVEGVEQGAIAEGGSSGVIRPKGVELTSSCACRVIVSTNHSERLSVHLRRSMSVGGLARRTLGRRTMGVELREGLS